MTIEEMRTAFHSVIGDDKLDTTIEDQLMNLAKTEIEDGRLWEILMLLTEANSSSASQDYKTTHSLPTRYAETLSLYIGDDRIPYRQIPFQHRERLKNISRRYYLDIKNDKYSISATGVTGTHHHWYKEFSPDIADSADWVFPARFHMLIPIRMARIFYPADRVERARGYGDEWGRIYDMLLGSAQRWNYRLQRGATRNINFPIDIRDIDDAVA